MKFNRLICRSDLYEQSIGGVERARCTAVRGKERDCECFSWKWSRGSFHWLLLWQTVNQINTRAFHGSSFLFSFLVLIPCVAMHRARSSLSSTGCEEPRQRLRAVYSPYHSVGSKPHHCINQLPSICAPEKAPRGNTLANWRPEGKYGILREFSAHSKKWWVLAFLRFPNRLSTLETVCAILSIISRIREFVQGWEVILQNWSVAPTGFIHPCQTEFGFSTRYLRNKNTNAYLLLRKHSETPTHKNLWSHQMEI